MSARLWLLALAPRPGERAAGADLDKWRTASAVQKPARRTIALRADVEVAAAEPGDGAASEARH